MQSVNVGEGRGRKGYGEGERGEEWEEKVRGIGRKEVKGRQ